MSRRDDSEGRGRGPTTIKSVLGQALDAMDLDRAMSTAEIAEIWPEVVGPEVARHSRPIGMKGDVLHAEVDSSVWSQQLQPQIPIILRALRGRLGEHAPREVRFRVGYNPAP
jgi:predicted nucleic acid-binding Zn ribbon protein